MTLPVGEEQQQEKRSDTALANKVITGFVVFVVLVFVTLVVSL